MKIKLPDIFSSGKKTDNEEKKVDEITKASILHEEQQEDFDHDLSILDDEAGALGERLQKQVEKEVRTTAEDSLRRLHLIQRGYCPRCGEHLNKHLSASICDDCGWHTFDAPRKGPVRIHLANRNELIEAERCYVVKTGAVLALKDDVVTARIPAGSIGWIEYVWDDEEIRQHHKQVMEQMTLPCGWCGKTTDPGQDGFHLVHVAFGSAQERYCFCSDECYEAFRKTYPSRVHRNCYERPCSECDLCVKRYPDELDGIYALPKGKSDMNKESA